MDAVIDVDAATSGPPHVDDTARHDESRAPLVRVAGVVGAGVAMALLVGRDGSPQWQLLRVAVVVAITILLSRVGARDRWGLVAIAVAGATVLAVGAGLVPYLPIGAASIEALAAVLLLLSGAAMVITSVIELVGHRRWPWRVAGTLGALIVVALVSSVVVPAVAVTNVPRSDVGATPASRGLDATAVTVTTRDGVELAGWYVSSGNGAAVVLRHGAGSTRSDVLDHAAVLAVHGYGVLMLDARGHGDSGGRAMDFGWYGDADIDAATRFLRARDDVDATRIGLVGLSMGGEEAIGAAAVDASVAAVVAEGATARTARDKEWLSQAYGARGWVQEQIERLQYGLTDLLTAADPPTPLAEAVARSTARFMLIAAGSVDDEVLAAREIASAAPDRAEVWTVSGADHTGGLATAPAEWEERVVDFLDETLPGDERR